jgi:hypothetical protein
MSKLIISTLVILFLFTLPLRAQTVPPTALPAKFALPDNPIALTHTARPNVYFDAIGRKFGLLANEGGTFEAWAFPLKLFHDARLCITVEGQDKTIDFASIVERVIARPEATTLVASDQLFTIRATFFSPIDEAGSIILLDIDTARPLTITASFVPDLKPMWPGGLGGQSAGWRDEMKAFVLSESRRKYNGFFGSPAAVKGIATPAHQLAAGSLRFDIKVDPQQAKRSFYPLIIAGGGNGRQPVSELYQRLAASVAEQYQKTFAHYRRLREELFTIETPDPQFNLASEWAKAALDKGMIDNPELGLGLVAGWGASGSGARPGFGWFFGGDAAINSYAMTGYGDFDSMRAAFKFLAKYQRADGKIPHEISQAAAQIKWFDEYPYAYYHADTTPLYIAAVYNLYRQSGDKQFISELWEPLKKAYQFCLANDTDDDGILENSKAGLGASELGSLLNDLHQDVYLAASNLEASLAMRELGKLMGDEALRATANEKAQKAQTALNERYWDPTTKRFGYALTKGGQVNAEITAWTAVPLFYGQLNEQRTAATLDTLSSAQLSTDWGTRMLSKSSPAYDPIAYNNGGVWPFLTGFVAAAEYQYTRHHSGFHHLQQLAQLTFAQAQGYHAEILSGDYYRPLDESVPHQLFSSGMVLTPLLRGLLGLTADAPNRELRVAPQLPAAFEKITARNFRLGESRLRFDFHRSNLSTLKLAFSKDDDQPLRLLLAPALPPFSKVRRVLVDGKSQPFTISNETSRVLCRFEHLLRRTVNLEIQFECGIEVDFPFNPASIGEPTQNAKILATNQPDAKTLVIQVEVLPGIRYQSRVRSQFNIVEIAGGSVLKEEAGWKLIEYGLPAEEKRVGYQRHQLTFKLK